MINLDAFKQIYDCFGHDFGDVYLTKFVYCLHMLAADHAIISRRSGIEFCMFLYGFENPEELSNYI